MHSDRLKRRVPPLNAIRSFEAAARHESFLKAGLELKVTPGAVSQLIKSLEDYLGVDLFVRYPRGVKLTEEGREYANAIGQSLDALSLATFQLLQNYQEPTLRICCYPTFAMHWLIPRWGDLQAAFPDMLLEMKTTLSPEHEDVKAYDLIVRIGRNCAREEANGIVSERVLDVRSFPVCSPDFLSRNPAASSLAKLPKLPLIHAATRPDDWDRWLASAGSSAAVGRRGQVFESLTLAYNAAVSGAGVAIGIEAFVGADITAGRLVQPVRHVRHSYSGFNMFYNASKANKKPRLRSVLEWIRNERERALKLS